MYIVYRSTSDGTRYASAAVSKRNGSRTSVSYTYLGRVLDEKAGIYQSEERGIFTFDPKSGEFGPLPRYQRKSCPSCRFLCPSVEK